MKQTKVVIVGLALALLFLGFSLGFYVTNRTDEVQIPAEAAYTEATDTVVMNLPDEAEVSAVDTIEEDGVIAVEPVVAEAPEPVESEPELAVAPLEELSPATVAAEPVAPVVEPAPEPIAPSPVAVAGTWQLASVDGVDVEDMYELFAKSGSRFGGETPCNAFYGTYAADGTGHTKTTSFGDTGVSCGSAEATVRQVLEQGRFLYRTTSELVVSASGHELVFVR